MDIINTIFYFPDSLTFEDYSEKLSRGEISERTIVFASEQKSVYKNGKKYGGLSLQEFRDLIDTLYGDSWISDELNGVKEDVTGVITKADQSNTLISTLKDRLDDEIAERDANIQGKVELLMRDAQWIQQNFPQGVTQWDERWDSDLEAYLRTVGYWTTDGNQTVTQWSKLQQSINSVESSVNSLKQEGNLSTALTSSIEQLIQNDIASLSLGTTYARVSDVDETKRVIEWLYSGLQTSASAEKTFAQLQSMAKNEFTSAISEIRTQVEKVKNGDFVATADMTTKVGDSIAALLQQADGQNALATLAARLDTADAANNDRINAALIGLGVDKNTATADISTSIGNVMSGFTSSADVTNRINTATAGIYSAIGAKDGNGNFISLAALKTYAEENRSAISAITNTGDNTAGFITESTLGSAVAQLFASSGDGQDSTAKANVVALVRDNKSELNLSASDINIDGYLNAGSATFKGNIQATSFTTGNSNEVGIGVMSGEFNEQLANPNKAYFAYDSTQGGITMWYYQNNAWKRLNLADSAVIDSAEAFGQQTFYIIPDDSITIIPKNIQTVTLYYNRVTAKYYNTPDTTDPATGVYYTMPSSSSLFSVDSQFKSPHGRPSTPYDVACTVREVYPNGNKVKCGVLSEFNIIGYISKVTINNGSATTSQNKAMIAHAVVDLYTSQPKAVVAPVILSQYKNRIWDTTGASYTGQNYYSSRIINFNGGMMSRTDSSGPAASMNKGHVMISLAEALAETKPQGWSVTVGGNLRGWSTSNSYTMIYPEDQSYPY